MAHLDENTIVAFFAAGRTDEVVTRVEAHAAGCEACRTLLAEFAALARTEKPVVTEPLGGPPVSRAGSETSDKVELVHRLALAQATKRIGSVVSGKWEVDALLGVGGMSLVYSARHRNGRKVAMKFMRPELALEKPLVERFLREGYVANKIDHPGAVAILDDDIAEDGTPFLVMELLKGEGLGARLARGPVPLDEAIRISIDVLDVLAIAHDKGIVHRDLKPDNLFAMVSGEIKVLDFGIARLKESSTRDVQTSSGTTMGTLGYMPPEQARGLIAEVDARSDLWAVGATLYALLSGRSLHEAPTPNESLLLAMTTPAPPMGKALPTVPRAVQAILDRALSYDKQQRYANAREMRAALDAALRDLGESPPRLAPGSQGAAPRRVWPLVALATIGVIALGGGVAAVARRSAPSPVAAPVGLISTAPEMASSIAPLPSPPSLEVAPATSSAVPVASTPTGTKKPRTPHGPARGTPTVSAAPSSPPDPLGPRQ